MTGGHLIRVVALTSFTVLCCVLCCVLQMTATRHSAMTFLVFSVITISTLLNLAGMTWAQQASPSAQPHADDGKHKQSRSSGVCYKTCCFHFSSPAC